LVEEENLHPSRGLRGKEEGGIVTQGSEERRLEVVVLGGNVVEAVGWVEVGWLQFRATTHTSVRMSWKIRNHLVMVCDKIMSGCL
jgi:hypothetical protein